MLRTLAIVAIALGHTLVSASMSCAQQAAPSAEPDKAIRVPRGTVQSPLRKLRESGEAAPPSDPAAVPGKIMRYADKLIEKYDQDGDKRLSAEETANLPESLRVSDFDRDGFITAEEFIRRIMAYSRRRSIRVAPLTPPSPIAANTPAPATADAAPGPAATAEGDAKPQPPKRFVVSSDRLPSGLAEWFLKSDADGDGQVTLAEMSTIDSPDVIAEFTRYDVNGDGVITAIEFIAAQKEPAKAAPATEATVADESQTTAAAKP